MKIGSFRYPYVVPQLTEKMRVSRVEFAENHLNDRFSNVLFCNDSYFPLFRQTKIVFAFKDEELPRFAKPTSNEGVMFWGVISRKGASHIFVANVDADYYMDIIQNLLH